ncbi:MAG: Kdo hydroxylase family protein [Rhizomicrobium sp.]
MTGAPSREISEIIETLDLESWDEPARTNMAGSPVDALENGKVLYFPRLAFALSAAEARFLSPGSVDAGAKNVSFDPGTGAVKHARGSTDDVAAIAVMMRRYSDHATALVTRLVPHYAPALIRGRTSFRPVEIDGRETSPRKDDTRLHVDAFPSSPAGQRRILRVFTNVNPGAQSRHWRLGDRFENVARHFAPAVSKPLPGSAWLMKSVGITKGVRTPYDHLMLNIHDTMKGRDDYQRDIVQNEFHFPPGSTWIVFTDQVSHAAMGGQHLFEQTFYLPVKAMADETKSPLRVLERATGRALV